MKITRPKGCLYIPSNLRNSEYGGIGFFAKDVTKMTLAESKLVVDVERLIEAFSDMAKKNALLIGNNVKQEELLTQIIDTITSAAAGIENCNEQE